LLDPTPLRNTAKLGRSAANHSSPDKVAELSKGLRRMRDDSQGQLSDREQELIEQWKREEQEPFAGWDFSHLDDRWHNEDPPWSYEELVRPLMVSASSVLDLGTGGGEKLLAFRDIFPPRVAVTEGYAPNLRLVRERLEPLGVEVVESQTALYDELPFESNSFDLVIDRHSGFNIAEVERVLAPGGTFLTQQVDGRNFSDLSAAFDCQQPWTFFTLDWVLEKIEETQLVVEIAQEWTGKTVFADVGAIVYYLKAVPWTVEKFSAERNQAHLFKLQQRLEREGELVFSDMLMLIKAAKS
jgi:SAM-dependent methyltransferase